MDEKPMTAEEAATKVVETFNAVADDPPHELAADGEAVVDGLEVTPEDEG